jgi:LysR family glycine cleavage system transcriptional activator
VALVNLALVTDELHADLLCQPFGPELTGQAFHLAWAEAQDADPDIAEVRAWLVDEASRHPVPATA